MKSILLSILILLCITSHSTEGWQITTRYYNVLENPLNARLEQVLLYKSYMKMVTGDLTTIFDIAKGEIIYINSSNQTYWKGNPSRFNVEVRAELEVMIEQKLFGVEQDQKEALRAVYNEMLNTSFPVSSEGQERVKRNFSVKKGADGKPISGYSTLIYNIFDGGLPLETMWIAPELTIAKDFDFINLSHFLNQLASGAYAESFESSEEYFKLIEKGYPVRVEMVKSDGYTYVSEVVEAKQVTVTASEFTIPKGYNAGTLSDVGVWNGL